jgi:hypothetical protein
MGGAAYVAAVRVLASSSYFTPTQLAGPTAITAAVFASALPISDSDPRLREFVVASTVGAVMLTQIPRLVVGALAVIVFVIGVGTNPECGLRLAAFDLTLFASLAIALSVRFSRAVSVSVPIAWVSSLVASSSARGMIASVWRLPLDCDVSDSRLLAGLGLLLAVVGIERAVTTRR